MLQVKRAPNERAPALLVEVTDSSACAWPPSTASSLGVPWLSQPTTSARTNSETSTTPRASARPYAVNITDLLRGKITARRRTGSHSRYLYERQSGEPTGPGAES